MEWLDTLDVNDRVNGRLNEEKFIIVFPCWGCQSWKPFNDFSTHLFHGELAGGAYHEMKFREEGNYYSCIECAHKAICVNIPKMQDVTE